MNVIVGRCEHGVPVAFCGDDSGDGIKVDMLSRYWLERVPFEKERIKMCRECNSRVESNRALLEDTAIMGEARRLAGVEEKA